MNTLFEKIRNNQVYVIAEMSANHSGKLENALEIVRRAAEIGVDCVKIQTYTADTITINCNRECFRIHGGLWDGYVLYDLYKDAGTPWEWHEAIKEECEKQGVDFLSTPFDSSAVEFLDNLGVEAYKIASFELVDIPLIEYAASKGKTMILSCGMANIEEIQEAVDACYRVGNRDIVLLKCCSEYPSNWEDMHLANIRDMKERFGLPIGLSDHSFGSIGAIAAVALGACVVEKHIKLDGVSSADSEFSMPVDEFGQMVKDIRVVETMVGRVSYSLTEGELASTQFRRSLFAVKDISVGDVFTPENIRSIRPSNGLPPKYYSLVIGTKAKRDIKRGDPLIEEDLL